MIFERYFVLGFVGSVRSLSRSELITIASSSQVLTDIRGCSLHRGLYSGILSAHLLNSYISWLVLVTILPLFTL
jgi:hypothetical protein